MSREPLHQPQPLRGPALQKTPTGIAGFDSITGGGLPAGRPTLMAGGAGCGKTLFAMTFLVNGIREYGEPGVFMSFEERAEELAANVASLGYDLPELVACGKLVLDHVRVERGEIDETGEYDLEGLFVRLGHAIGSIGAKRVVLDTLEALFSGLSNTAILRAELRRLFGWLRDRGVTAVITAERGDGQLIRNELEEYVSDCVVLLDNRVVDQVTTRRLRVVKYRGSAHGTNEYPFLIDGQGITVIPITSAGLAHKTFNETVSTGVPALDHMLGADGYYRGSTVLISGEAGTGKTILGAHFADAACRRGERCLYFVFEESPEQLCRNVKSVGIDLARHVESGLLRFAAARPSLCGLEMHLARMTRDLETFDPAAVVIDPISALRAPRPEMLGLLVRLVDLLKARGITAVFTSLKAENDAVEERDEGLASLVDTWIKLINIEANGERNRGLYVIKSRGMGHSNQIREYRLTDHGVDMIEPYVGPHGVLTGSARLTQEARERAEEVRRRQETERLQRDIERKRESVERRIAEMRAALEAEAEEARLRLREEETREVTLTRNRETLAERRGTIE